jgi:K+-transporting ATPase ATPase C chain
MRRQLFPALGMLLVFTVLAGLLYPLAFTGVAQVAFRHQANGSLIRRDGRLVGSSWIGQPFTQPRYFHPRPAADDYVPGAQGGGTYSYGSNLGPTSAGLGRQVRERVRAYRSENGLAPDARVPVDAVTASGSGLDPHISVANARLQARRVAAARHLSVEQVLRLVGRHTDGRDLGFLGEPGVNVLELNLALDATR